MKNFNQNNKFARHVLVATAVTYWLVWALLIAAMSLALLLLLGGCAAEGDAVPFDGGEYAAGTTAVRYAGEVAVWSDGRCSFEVVALPGEAHFTCLTAGHCVADIGEGTDAVVEHACPEKSRVGLTIGPTPDVGDVVWTYGRGCERYQDPAGEPNLRPALVVDARAGRLQLDVWPRPVCGGDSGGAVLDASGRLVGVISRWVSLERWGRPWTGVEALPPVLGVPSAWGEPLAGETEVANAK